MDTPQILEGMSDLTHQKLFEMAKGDVPEESGSTHHEIMKRKKKVW